MAYKWTLAGFVVVLLMAAAIVVNKGSESAKECYDAGGLIVQTDKGWRCVEAK